MAESWIWTGGAEPALLVDFPALARSVSKVFFSGLIKFFIQLPIESTRLDNDDSVFEAAAQVFLTFKI